jgi:hypothetical protein
VADEVYANSMEISCKAADGKSICAFPDVCFTPPENPATPPGVPIPYPNTSLASDCSDGSSTVSISGEEVMLKNKSYFKKSSGDEAGCAAKKGLITSQNTGKAYFTAWSMDVKFEGENVVRHLDLTTGNHACPTPNQPTPWPHASKQAIAKGGKCNKKAPKDYGSQVKKNCNPDMYCKECCECDGRKCMLMPYDPNQCCKGKNGKKLTPHHPIPFQDHYEVGARTGKRAALAKLRLDGAGDYDGNAAPCICVEGTDHKEMEPKKRGQPPLHKEHGRLGRAGAHARDQLPGKTYEYKQINKEIAKQTAAETGCSQECILAQLDYYHVHKAKATGELRKSRQPRKDGDTYAGIYSGTV